MAYASSGATNKELIDALIRNRILSTEKVIDAFRAVDRANFVLDKAHAYQDSPQSIGYGATISAPHMHAYALEATHSYLKPGARVLDVGSGSGYLLPIYANLVSPSGLVVGIDHHKDITSLSRRNLSLHNKSKTNQKGGKSNEAEIIVLTADGRKGAPDHGPFDIIHVGAASPTTPTALLEQLKCPGRMFVPVGTDDQYIKVIDKDAEGEISVEKSMPVRYIPLGDLTDQKSLF